MKKIVRLTESDLVNIVKRVISEDDKTDKANKCGHSTWERYEKSGWKCTPIINCNQLNGMNTDQMASIVAQDLHTRGKGKPLVTYSYSTFDEPNKYKGEVINEDPYSYVKLFNGKYCSKKENTTNWVEVKGTDAIEAVKKAMSVDTNALAKQDMIKKGYIKNN